MGVVSRAGGRGTGCDAFAVVLGGCGTLAFSGPCPLAALFGRALIAGLLVTGAFLAVTTPEPWKEVGLGVAAMVGRP